MEAVPGLWQTGAQEGFVLLAAMEEDVSLCPGDVVAEVRAGLVETTACGCGAALSLRCKSCGVSKLVKHEESCFACGSSARVAARSRDAPPARGPLDGRGKERRSLLAAASILSSCIGGSALQGTPVQDPSVVTFLSNFTARDQWWDAPGGQASVTERLAVFRTRRGPKWAGWQAGSATCGLKSTPSRIPAITLWKAGISRR